MISSMPRRVLALLAVSWALAFAIGSPVAAGENSWSPLPFDPRPEPPEHLLATSDPNVWYWLGYHLIWRSDDGGHHFARVEAPDPASGFKVDAHDPSRLFLFDGASLLRSSDAGSTWRPVLSTPLSTLWQVEPSPHVEDRVYALIAETLWASEDGGASFAPRGPLPTAEDVPIARLVEAADGGLFLLRSDYCGYHHCGGRGLRIYRSADRGVSWQQVFESRAYPPYAALVADPERPETLYLRSGDVAPPRLWLSDDRGATFSEVGPAPEGELQAVAGRSETLLVLGGEALSRSADGGRTWQTPALPTALAPGGATLTPAGRIRIWGAPPPGAELVFYESADLGSSWGELRLAGAFPGRADGLSAGAVPGLFYISRWPGRLFTSTDGAVGWSEKAIPESLFLLAADSREAASLYFEGREEVATLWRSRDGGDHFEAISPDWGRPVQDFALFPTAGGTALAVLLSDGRFYRSAGDAGWSEPSYGAPSGAGWRLLEEDHGVLYAGTSSAEVYRSLDGGATWSWRSSGHASFRAGGGLLVDVEPAEGRLELSTDGGASWQTRLLPFASESLFVDDLQVDPFGAVYLFSGRRLILRSRDQGRTWQSLSPGLSEYGFSARIVVDPFAPDHLLLAGERGLYGGYFRHPAPLPLLGGRFTARLGWVSEAGVQEAAAATLGDETAFFSLFTPDRAEALLRVVDRRAENGHFEIALAALTDVPLELEVIDRETGEVFRRELPAFRGSWREPAAFPLAGVEPAAGPLPRIGLDYPSADPVVVVQDRFEIAVSVLAAGELRVATGRPLLGDGALFAFLPRGPAEIFVNLIDGRPLNGQFWVFGASFTDLPFVVTVKDRQSGVVRVYSQPGGVPATFNDLGAFD